MKAVKLVLLVLLVIYSASIIWIEATRSQEHVRYYVTDIYGPVFLYAVNTTMSTALLWSSALVFVISAMCLEEAKSQRRRLFFYGSQALIFAYLGFDERFMIHEYAGLHYGFNDALMLLAIASAEAGILIGFGELNRRPKRLLFFLAASGTFFGCMLFIDAFVPKTASMRLSFEDLSKLWAEVFLFLFAFGILRGEITDLKRRAGAVEPARAR